MTVTVSRGIYCSHRFAGVVSEGLSLASLQASRLLGRETPDITSVAAAPATSATNRLGPNGGRDCSGKRRVGFGEWA